MTGAVGAQPVALAETPDAQNLYVVNQGNSTVTDLSPADLSTLATIPVGNTPVWAVSRNDSKRVYVVTQGDGQLYTIRHRRQYRPLESIRRSAPAPTSRSTIQTSTGSTSPIPARRTVYVFDVTSDSPTLITALTADRHGGATAPCPTGCSPVSVAALPDGSRFYVASYQNAVILPRSSCRSHFGLHHSHDSPCLTRFSLTVKPVTATLLHRRYRCSAAIRSRPVRRAPRLPLAHACDLRAEASTRFRMFTTAAADSSHVYVSICDAGSIADINTTTSTISSGGNNTPDTLVTDLGAPFAACTNFSLCGAANSITSFSIASNVVTFQSANNFVAGQRIQVVGLTTGTYLNGLNLTVLPTGLSGSQFQCYFTILRRPVHP